MRRAVCAPKVGRTRISPFLIWKKIAIHSVAVFVFMVFLCGKSENLFGQTYKSGDGTFKLKDALSLGVTVDQEFDTNIFETWDIHNEFDFVTRISPKVSLKFDEANLFRMFTRSGSDRNNRDNNRNDSNRVNNNLRSQRYPGAGRGSGNGGRGTGGRGRASRADAVPNVNIGFSLDLDYYALHPDLNTQNSGSNFFQPDFGVELYPDEGLKLYYKYDRTRNDISSLDPLGRSRDKDKVYTSTHRYGVNYDFGPRWDTWFFSYQHTDTDNEDNNDLDRNQDTWSLDVNVTNPPGYLPKLFFEYSGQRAGGGSGGDKTNHELFAGLRGVFSPKISGDVKIGYGISSPSDNIFAFDNITGDLIYQADLNYDMTERVDIGFTFEKNQRNVTAFAIDSDTTNDASSGLNIPRSTEDSWNVGITASYTPPFFSENLRLQGTANHTEIEYSDGSRQKVQEFGFRYTYVWRGLQHKRYRDLDGKKPSNRNYARNRNNTRQTGSNNVRGGVRSARDRNLFIFLDALNITGELKTRRVSPDAGWSRFNDNMVSLTVKWEL